MRRRDLLRLGSAALFAAAAGGPYWATFRPDGTLALVPRWARASGQGTLVAIFLRGGLDGLHALVPHGEERYYRVRPRLSVPPPGRTGGCLDLDGRCALHPALEPLMPIYREGVLAVVQGIGTPESSRSHFEAQDFLEAGGRLPDGWLNRYLQGRPGSDPLRGLSTTHRLPFLLQGPVPVASVASLEDAALRGLDPGGDPLQDHGAAVERALARLDPASYRPAASYPPGRLAEQLRLVAFLLKSGVALEAVHAEIGGFDTHARQVDPRWPGSGDGLNGLLHHLGESLAAFWRDLGPHGARVVVVTLTEFGRRVAENGSLGTDHGRASCAFVLGGEVRGGRVVGRFAGLEEEALEDGMDLPVTTDYRDLFVEVAAALATPDPTTLFPGFAMGPGPGLFR